MISHEAMSSRPTAPGRQLGAVPVGTSPGRRTVVRALAASLLAAGVGCRSRQADEQDRGTLRVALQGEPTSLDPHLQDDVISYSVLLNVFEALTAFDVDMRLRPGLATGWHSRDESTWEFELRTGVRFHDGRPLEAEDVVASLERARSMPGSKTAGFLVGVQAVRATSASRVEVVTRRPSSLLAKKLAWVAVVPRDAPRPIAHPVGTGPLRFASREGAVIHLERAASHWGGPLRYGKVEVLSLPGGTERAEQLARGAVDIVVNLDSSTVPGLETRPDLRIVSRPSLAVGYLGFRCDRPPFADVRLRRAVDLAVDRERLVRALRGSLGSASSQIVDRHVFGFDPSLPAARHDVAAARELVAASGYPGGIDLTLEHRQGFESGPLVQQLGEAGLRLKVATRPWGELMARLSSGVIEMYFGGLVCPTGDASDVLDQVVHSRDEPSGYGSGNHWGYVNPALDALVEKSAATFDQAERLAVLQQAMGVLREDLPLLPLYVPFNAAGVRKPVVWEPRLDGMFRAGDVRPG
jgi:peptide/nickel transport system substrate-binding protein